MEDLGSNFPASKYDILTTEPEVAVLAVLYEVEVYEELGHVDAAEDVLGVAHDVPGEGGNEDRMLEDTDLTSDDILQEDILGVCGGRHLQLEPPAIVVAAQGPEVGLLQISRNNVIFRRSINIILLLTWTP